jgi:hypothetical protein
MKVHVLKPIRVDRLGGLKPGAVVELHPSVGKAYLQQGAVELYETKVIRERPLQAAGEAQPSSASQAVQASPQTTLSESDSGEPKRKRGKRKTGE